MSFKHGPNLPKKTSWVVRVGNPSNYLLATNMSCILYYHHCFNQSFFLVSSYHYPLVGDGILSFYFLFCFVLLDSQESLAKQAKYVTIIPCIVFIYNFRHYFIFDLKADSGRDFFANIVSIWFWGSEMQSPQDFHDQNGMYNQLPRYSIENANSQ